MFRIAALLIVSLSLVDGARAADIPATQPATRPQPDPKYSPADVVRIQLTAMQHNDQPQADAGIATAFRFASPKNQEMTGPLDHFTEMIKTGQYTAMIDFKSADYAPAQVTTQAARQLVKLTDSKGNQYIFLFILTLQSEGKYKDCWMTDGVVRLENDHPADSPSDAPAPPTIKA